MALWEFENKQKDYDVTVGDGQGDEALGLEVGAHRLRECLSRGEGIGHEESLQWKWLSMSGLAFC